MIWHVHCFKNLIKKSNKANFMLSSRTPFLALTAVLSLFFVAESSYALPVDLDIDFRDGTVWGGHGDGTFTNGAVTVDANGNRLHRDNTDGYGVQCGEWDEIDRQEMLIVWFDDAFFDDPANWLTGVLLTDLFPTPDGGPNGEAGWVTLFDAAGDVIVDFFVNAVDYVANGEFYLDFGGAYAADHVVFTAFADHSGSEFSVAGFTTRGVPEPGTLALLGVGLLFIGFSRRSRIPARAV